MRGDEVACPWLPPREAGPGLDIDPLSLLVVFVSSNTFLAEECGKLKSSRAGNSDQQLTGQPAVPTGEPSLHAKASEGFGSKTMLFKNLLEAEPVVWEYGSPRRRFIWSLQFCVS